jgi:hypothetical protein
MPMNDYQNNYNPQIPMYINNNNINNLGYNQEMEGMNNNNNNSNINNNNVDMFFDAEDDYDFFDNEQKHLQRVHNKIMNLKNEKISKIEEQCTFAPKININRKYLKNENNSNSNNNVFIKLYNESSKLKKKNQERIKKTIDSYKFTPVIEGNEKYKVKLPFEKRLEKSIKKKGQFINDKLKEEKKKMEEELVNKNVKVDVEEVLKRIYYDPVKEMKKEKEKENAKKKEEKPVIDWKKRCNFYNAKENDYKKQLEKRRKFLNSVSINTNINGGNNGNIIDFNQFMNEVEKEKEKTNDNNNNNISDNINNNTNNNNDEDDKNNNNIGEDNNEEDRKENSPEGLQDAINVNEAYKSTSLQQLLNANNN